MYKMPNKSCRNCGAILPEESVYCPSCSQKRESARMSLSMVFKDFFDHVFALDSRLLKTVHALIIPGKLTKDYFNGIQVRYYHPFRLFFLSGAALLTLITLRFETANGGENSLEKSFARHQRHKDYAMLDSIGNLISKEQNTRQVNAAIDTLLNRFSAGDELENPDSVDLFVLGGKKKSTAQSVWTKKVSMEDHLTLKEDDLANKYQVFGFWNRIAFTQYSKIWKQQEGIIFYILGNCLWMMFVMMPAFALLLKLLYIRRDFYFVEHLIFSFNIHTMLFLGISILLVFSKYFNGLLLAIFLLSLVFYLYKSLKTFYEQTRLKTLAKFFLAGSGYLLLFSISVIFTVFISFLVF
jgi:hypothetical protein